MWSFAQIIYSSVGMVILSYIDYLLTPWCRVLLEQLTGLQSVKKFPTFHGTRRFITALTSVRHLSILGQPNAVHILTSHRSVLILSTHLSRGLPSGLLPSGFPTKTFYTPLSSPMHATCTAHLILFHFNTRTILVSSTNHLAPRYTISSIPPLPLPSSVQIFSSTPCSQTPSASFPPSMSATTFHTHTKQ